MPGFFDNLFTNPNQAGLLGLSAGLLQASGPSRQPVSFGQSLSQGLLTSNAMFNAAVQAQQRSGLVDAQTKQLMLENELLQKKLNAGPSPIKLGPGDTAVDPNTFKPLYQAPFAPKDEKTSPLGQLIKEFNELPQTAPPAIRQFYQDAIRKATTHAPAASQSVEVKTGESFYKSVANKVGEQVAATGDAAHSAVGTIQAANQIREGLDSGKIIAGPGATLRIAGAQIAQTLGFSGPDALVATRNAVQGLAKLALGARAALKGQGQISDYEGKLLTKAETGNIDDLTLPEIRTIADVADRAARLKIRQNAKNVERLRKQDETKSFADFLEVPEPPEYGANSTESGQTKTIGGKTYIKRGGQWFEQ